MKDRVSAFPGRVKLVPVTGQTNIYDLTRADQPSQVGTGLVKENLLSDEVAKSLGLDPTSNPTVNDAFARIAYLIENGGGGGGGDSGNDPIGTIRYSATSPGSNWLLCDGELITSTEYPELVSLLWNQSGGGMEWNILSNGKIGSGISNGVVYDGYYWIYSLNNKKIYGISLSNGTTKEIPVNCTTAGYSNLTSTSDKPITFSIVNGRAFISQIRSTTSASASSVTLVQGAFSGDKSVINFSDTFSSYNNSNVYGANNNLIPYVIASNGYFYMCVGPNNGYVYYWRWNDSSSAPGVNNISQNVSTGTTYTVSASGTGKFSFNRKNNYEMAVVQRGYRSGYVYYSSIKSAPIGSYSDTNNHVNIYDSFIRRDNSSITPIMGNNFDALVDAAFDSKTIKLNISDKGTTKGVDIASIVYPTSSKFFPDAAVYLSNKGLWMIFIGSGFLFSNDITSADAFGFVNTTNQLGTITQLAYIESSDDENTIYISGQDTQSHVIVAKVDVTNFTGSDSEIYLPELSKDGIPGYIKAKM